MKRQGRNCRDSIRIVLEAVKRRAMATNGHITDALLLAAQEAARREIGGAADYVNLRLPTATRHNLYRADLAAGLTSTQVARKYQVSVRTVESAGKTPTECFGEEYSGAEGENG